MSTMPSDVTPLRRLHENWTKGGPVVSDLDDREITALEGRAAATIAEPGPMGIWALATGTWILGATVALYPPTAMMDVIPMLLGFAGIAQFIAGLFAFRRTNVLAATTFCTFGAWYVTLALFYGLTARGVITTANHSLMIEGFMFEAFAGMALALAAASVPRNLTLVGAFLLLCAGYCLIGIPLVTSGGATFNWTFASAAGGWLLAISAILAYYYGVALVVNSTFARTMLPIGGEP
jgi:uncharacterized protein